MSLSDYDLIKAYKDAPVLTLAKILGKNILKLSNYREFCTIDRDLLYQIFENCGELDANDVVTVYNNIIRYQTIPLSDFICKFKTDTMKVVNVVGNLIPTAINPIELKDIMIDQHKKIVNLELKIRELQNQFGAFRSSSSISDRYDERHICDDYANVNNTCAHCSYCSSDLRRLTGSPVSCDYDSFHLDAYQDEVKMRNSCRLPEKYDTSPMLKSKSKSSSYASQNKSIDKLRQYRRMQEEGFVRRQYSEGTREDTPENMPLDDGNGESHLNNNELSNDKETQQLDLDKIQQYIRNEVNSKFESITKENNELNRRILEIKDELISQGAARFILDRLQKDNKKFKNEILNKISSLIPPEKPLLYNENLLDAIEKNDHQSVKWAIHDNPLLINMKCPDLNNATPLHIASKFGDVDIVRTLISKGASVNRKDAENETPLFYAAKFNNADVLTYLLNHGADINHRNKYMNTPLHYASIHNHHNICQLLKSRGAI